MDAVIGVEGESGVVEAHVKDGPGRKTGLKKLRCEHFLRGAGINEGSAQALAEGKERENQESGDKQRSNKSERSAWQGAEERQAGAGEQQKWWGKRQDVTRFLVRHCAEEDKLRQKPQPMKSLQNKRREVEGAVTIN